MRAKQMKVNRKAILGIFCTILISWTLLSAIPVRTSFSGSLEDLPWSAGAPQPYSYKIETNGSYTFAFNGTTSECEISSTDGSAVLEYAIDHLPYDTDTYGDAPTYVFGGHIIIGEGAFNFQDIELKCYARGYIWISGMGKGKTLVYNNGGTTTFYWNYTDSQMANFIHISDLSIGSEASPTNSHIYIRGVNHLTLENLGIYDCPSAAAIYVDKCYIGVFRDLSIQNCYGGMEFHSAIETSNVNTIEHIEFSSMFGAPQAILVSGSAYYKFTNIIMHGNLNVTTGIKILATSSDTCTAITVENLGICDYVPDYGIYIEGYSADKQVRSTVIINPYLTATTAIYVGNYTVGTTILGGFTISSSTTAVQVENQAYNTTIINHTNDAPTFLSTSKPYSTSNNGTYVVVP